MTYFAELSAPDLAHLGDPLASRLIVAMLFHGKNPPSESSVSRFLTGFVMVTDKAIREYRAGRDTLIAYSKSDNQMLVMFEGVGRMETCIHSAKRAFRFLERIGRTKSTLALDRTLRKLAKSSEDQLTAIRNAIEHVDTDIATAGGLNPGEAHLLAIDHAGEFLEIARHRISLRSLSETLATLHKTGVAMMAALPNANAPPPQQASDA